MIRLIFVCFILFSISFCVTPPHPYLPSSWEAGIRQETKDSNGVQIYFGFFYYSILYNSERFDFESNIANVSGQILNDYNNDTQYYVNGETLQCDVRSLYLKKIPDPDFADYTYIGTAIINNTPCYQWQKNTGPFIETWYDAQSTGYPVRSVNESKYATVIVDFYSFRASFLDKSLFDVPYQCT